MSDTSHTITASQARNLYIDYKLTVSDPAVTTELLQIDPVHWDRWLAAQMDAVANDRWFRFDYPLNTYDHWQKCKYYWEQLEDS